MVWTRLNSMAGRRILSERPHRPRFLPVVPDGFQIAGQLRERAEIGLALSLSVVIGAARGAQAESARIPREFEVLLRRVASGDDLDSLAPAVPELRKKRMQLGSGELVAARVRNDGDPAACAYPVHGVTERGPLVLHETGLAFHQVALKHALHVRCLPSLDEVSCKMGTADQVRVLGVDFRPREAAWNAGGGQRFAHFLRPFRAPFPDRFEAGP